jgi:hypothetical protein
MGTGDVRRQKQDSPGRAANVISGCISGLVNQLENTLARQGTFLLKEHFFLLFFYGY